MFIKIYNIYNAAVLKKLSGLIFCLSLCDIGLSQDIHFSQLSQTQFFSNPAFAGIQFGPRILAHYRNEYPNIGSQINSGFNTYFVSFDQYIKDYNSGIGAQVIADKFGDNIFSRYYVNINYAYQAKFNEYHALRFGLSVNIVHQQLDRSRLVFYDQIDPINGFSQLPPTSEDISMDLTQTGVNFNAGLVYFTNYFYAGLSARNMLPNSRLKNTASKQFEDIVLSSQVGGVYWFNQDKRIGLFPYFLFDRQYGYNKFVGNILYQYEMLNVGIGLRHNAKEIESFIFLAGFNFNKVRISYSYDLNLNGLGSYTGGSHEIGLRILFRGEDNSLYPNEYKNVLFCPDFMRN
ncbi:MAG: type IX secretion system membrane protein PorP/SprF [Chitinophagales bacterium]|nr:type IX secretion system membrane protein PorP/SprF [Sphingobacteriales bacterium]